MTRGNVTSRPAESSQPLRHDQSMPEMGNNRGQTPQGSQAQPPADILIDVARRDLKNLSEHAVEPDRNQQDRRTLLLIFIHGFMGDETSFQGFPAHLHNILTILLADSHIVHTKIYPRYRSRRNISFARDDFSAWLEPHESETTDIILLGHSMGGLLAADIVLIPSGLSAIRPFKHHILGTINFDVPFLGMHPGVVKSGLASIFKPADDGIESGDATGRTSISEKDQADLSRHSTSKIPLQATNTWRSSTSSDPNFNRPFTNDISRPVRKGWRSALHFITKHRHNLPEATKQLVSSHLEFGGALANYSELRARYRRVRALEEDDWRSRKAIIGDDTIPSRVRFVNYYTVSTGKPKKSTTSTHHHHHHNSNTLTRVPTLTVETPEQEALREAEGPDAPVSPIAARTSASRPVSMVSMYRTNTKFFDAMETLNESDDNDVSSKTHSTKNSRNPSPVVNTKKSTAANSPARHPDSPSAEASSSGAHSKKDAPKERTFCLLPPTDSQGHQDPCWARLFMENVDEVGAHCGLFLVDEKYERLVGDVASRIEAWIAEALDMDLSHLIGAG